MFDNTSQVCGLIWSPVEDGNRVHPQSSLSGSSPAQIDSAEVECVPRIFIQANLGDSYYQAGSGSISLQYEASQ